MESGTPGWRVLAKMCQTTEKVMKKDGENT
jgi:hypothetical protein